MLPWCIVLRLQLVAPIGRSLFASLAPFPSIGGGAHRPLTTLCPSSPSLAYLGPGGGGGGGGRVNIRRESIIVAGTLLSRSTDIVSASVSAPRDASLEPLGSRPVGAGGGSQDYRTFCTHVQQAFHYKLCKEQGGGGRTCWRAPHEDDLEGVLKAPPLPWEVGLGLVEGRGGQWQAPPKITLKIFSGMRAPFGQRFLAKAHQRTKTTSRLPSVTGSSPHVVPAPKSALYHKRVQGVL